MAGDALKVEDATWDADVMKASELVMVDFWAVWCGPCQMVAPIVEELAKEYVGKVKVRKLNTDENPEVAGRYQVMSIPTILFFKNGQVVEKLVGARPKRQFKEMLIRCWRNPPAQPKECSHPPQCSPSCALSISRSLSSWAFNFIPGLRS